MESILAGIIGLLVGLQLGKHERRANIQPFKEVGNIMAHQATHAQRLKLLYERVPGYHTAFLQALTMCFNYMTPEAQTYVARLMNEYNEHLLDIADAMEDFKNDSVKIEKILVEV